MSESPGEQRYWAGWERLQTQVEYLGKAVDQVQRDLPAAIEKTSERVRQDFLTSLAHRDTRYQEEQTEAKRQAARRDERIDELAKKVLVYGTIGAVLLTLLNLYPTLVKVLGGGAR